MTFTIRTLFALGACVTGLWTTAVAADDLRLSLTLLPDERADSGLVNLTSDQIAILDALVRRDIAAAGRTTPEREPKFSDRLTADERTNAGLTLLAADQLARLDSYVARLLVPPPSATFGYSAPRNNAAITARTLRRAPEIHGSISLMYGQGNDGYSERGGAMVLSYDDPSGVSLLVGYSEVHTKGGNFHRDYSYDRYRYGGLGYSGFGYGGLYRPFREDYSRSTLGLMDRR